MSWRPPRKFISDLKPIKISQTFEGSNVTLALFDELSFGREELALSAARTRLMSLSRSGGPEDERIAMMEWFGTHTAEYVSQFLTQYAEFSFALVVELLADDERTSLASRVGTAVADLVMERLGFCWRANTREFTLKLPREPSSASERLPDFIYDPGSASGYTQGAVVVVEAKGSLSKKRARRRRISSLAQHAYNDQVRHFIGARGDGVVVAGGFATAFGAIPGSLSSSLAIASPHSFSPEVPAGRLAHAASAAAVVTSAQQEQLEEEEEEEEEEEKAEPAYKQKHWSQASTKSGGDGTGGRGGDGDGTDGLDRRQPSGRAAFANYEIVFGMCGATQVARLLRRVLSRRGVEESEVDAFAQEFHVVESDGRFLTGKSSGRFWIYEPSARAILRVVQGNLQRPPQVADIGKVPDAVRGGPESVRVVQGDGLASLSLWMWSSSTMVVWHPLRGWI